MGAVWKKKLFSTKREAVHQLEGSSFRKCSWDHTGKVKFIDDIEFTQPYTWNCVRLWTCHMPRRFHMNVVSVDINKVWNYLLFLSEQIIKWEEASRDSCLHCCLWGNGDWVLRTVTAAAHPKYIPVAIIHVGINTLQSNSDHAIFPLGIFLWVLLAFKIEVYVPILA